MLDAKWWCVDVLFVCWWSSGGDSGGCGRIVEESDGFHGVYVLGVWMRFVVFVFKVSVGPSLLLLLAV